MRNGMIVFGILAIFSLGFMAAPINLNAEASAALPPESPAQPPAPSATLTDSVHVDVKASEKPIRIILPSPYETASR